METRIDSKRCTLTLVPRDCIELRSHRYGVLNAWLDALAHRCEQLDIAYRAHLSAEWCRGELSHEHRVMVNEIVLELYDLEALTALRMALSEAEWQLDL